jgi:hypothetical protein
VIADEAFNEYAQHIGRCNVCGLEKGEPKCTQQNSRQNKHALRENIQMHGADECHRICDL